MSPQSQPEPDNFDVTNALFVMVVFTILMVAALVSMIKNIKVEAKETSKSNPHMLIGYGVLIGLVTGF